MAAAVRVFYAQRRRATLVFWTVIGCGLIAASVVTYALHATSGRSAVAGQPTLAVMGVLLIAYVQGVYPAMTRLSLWPDRLELRGPMGLRSVPWDRVATMTSVSALTPATRGGNISGIRVRDQAGTLVMIVPDVFELPRDALLLVLTKCRRLSSRETGEGS